MTSDEAYSKCFANLSAADQCEAFESIGSLACAQAGTLAYHSGQHQATQPASCRICDAREMPQSKCPSWDGDQSMVAISTVINISKSPDFQKSTRSRVCAMLAVRKLIMHSTDSQHLRLADSPLGQWCLQSQSSSMRELRIAAG